MVKRVCQPGDKYYIGKHQYQIPKHLVFRDSMKFLSHSKLTRLSNLLENVIDILDQHGIFYIATAGTLLSAIRHKCLMPWDDDIDLAFKYRDYYRIYALRPLLLERGIEIIQTIPGFIIKEKNNPTIAIDMFQLNYDKSAKLYKYTYPCKGQLNAPKDYTELSDQIFPKEYFYKKELKKIKKVKFNHYYIKVPKYSNDILYRFYSKKCLKEVKGVVSTKVHILRRIQFVGPFIEKHFYKNRNNSIKNIIAIIFWKISKFCMT
jgi:hypothetical protein